ncbi:MAG TPA: M48 family metalloprotease [Casimicrobiaceae bacterium]|nr:M48 family metalloprotease [Casimicrobiaceae bacterium]
MHTSAWLKNVVNLALCLFAVPLLGWLSGQYLEHSHDRQFQQMLAQQKLTSSLSYSLLCAKLESEGVLANNSSAAKLCEPADDVRNVYRASMAIAAIGAILMLLIVGAKTLAGQNRHRMSVVFGPLIRVVLLLLAASVLAQAALFVFSIYVLEAAAIQRVHFGILVAVAIGAFIVCFQLLRAAFAFFKTTPNLIRGIVLDRSKYSNIYAFADGVAKKLNAQPPDNIIIGLEPNFFVTANEVKAAIPNVVLRGSTLYLSLSLMRLLSKEELCAVIGHELGHFRGEDTAYSLRFAPIYRRLSHTLNAMISGTPEMPAT